MSENFILNIHTLNHDLYFERLNKSDWFQGQICDGFEENGSKYYGKFDVDGRIYRVRLERYTGNYNKRCRLYKLHGSRDYGLYYSSKGAIFRPEKYLKTRFGIGFGEFYKEIKKPEGRFDYETCWLNYHADFLTGTTSKIIRYQEPLLYKTLFKHFKNNLKNAEKLIIIGYGCKDFEINNLIRNNFDYKNKLTYIIDPYAGAEVLKLNDELGGKLITKELEHINIQDIY